MPLPSLLQLFFFFFLAENVGSLKTQISQKNAKPQTSDENKKQKKRSLQARQGHTKNVRNFSGSNSKKRRGHWHLKEFWVLCLNQPVNHYGNKHRQCFVPYDVSKYMLNKESTSSTLGTARQRISLALHSSWNYCDELCVYTYM